MSLVERCWMITSKFSVIAILIITGICFGVFVYPYMKKKREAALVSIVYIGIMSVLYLIPQQIGNFSAYMLGVVAADLRGYRRGDLHAAISAALCPPGGAAAAVPGPGPGYPGGGPLASDATGLSHEQFHFGGAAGGSGAHCPSGKAAIGQPETAGAAHFDSYARCLPYRRMPRAGRFFQILTKIWKSLAFSGGLCYP